MEATREFTGLFKVEQKIVESTGNYRTIVKKTADGKQVGSTFDDDLAAKLLSYADGTTLTVTVQQSGKFWNVIDVRLADAGAAVTPPPTPAPAAPAAGAAYTPAPSSASAPVGVNQATGEIAAFSGHDLTYFMGYASRLVAAAIKADPAYAARLAATNDIVLAASEDVMRSTLYLIEQSNKRG